MLFNSFHFAAFFPIVTLLYFLLAHRLRVPLLVAASCYFYMAFVPAYVLILFVVIGIDYVAGRLIEPAQGFRRKGYLTISILANVGVLCFFKYFNFLQANIASAFAWAGQPPPFSALDILLPIGLSFHTFQSMSYTIEVYRGHTPAERSLIHFACYVLYYPQLVAGPIERPQNLLPQFHALHNFDGDRLFSGLRLMATGLFKKVVIADRLAPFVDAAYSAPERFSGADLLVATYFFAIQIYCDFSGYSDIARGASRAMGIELMLNFDRPYLSASFSDFWRRWHISLSTWFRDYLYIPLGGNRSGAAQRARNLLIVFAVSGIWHGANWTFVVWGALHGLFLIIEIGLRGSHPPKSPPFAAIFRGLVVFNLTCLAWVFFRAANLETAHLILARIATDFGSFGKLTLPGTDSINFAIGVALIVGLLIVEAVGRKSDVWTTLDKKARWMRWAVYYVLVLIFILLSFMAPSRTAQPFIYFQF